MIDLLVIGTGAMVPLPTRWLSSVLIRADGELVLFDNGRLTSIEPWRPDSGWRADAAIPEKAFLYLVFGSRSLREIEHAFPDTRIRTDLPRVLLDTLFPPTQSVIWPIG